MNPSLTDYYLQKLGVKRWVLRSTKDKNFCVCVLSDPILGNAKKLFNNILKSVQLTESNFKILHDQAEIETYNPHLIVVLGENKANSLLSLQLNHNIPVIVSKHPDFLLKNPKFKYEAYKDWLSIKQKVIQAGL
jgi:DNA polymerase III psi subunit